MALRTLWPRFTLNADAAAVVVGVFGTTISPYLFFWQASEEVEDMQATTEPRPSSTTHGAAGMELSRIRWDTWSGMLYSDLTAYFIILATAVTLNVGRHYRYRNRGAGGKRAAATCRRPRIHLFAARHSRGWPDRSTGSCRLCRLCSLRSNGLEMGASNERPPMLAASTAS